MSPGSFQVRDADVVAALLARGQPPTSKAIQYSMRQIVFVVPRGSPDSVRAARVREAEALRSKFSDCERDLYLAREYREVVVMDPVIRISTDLPQRLQQLLEKTPDGRMTPPEPTASGIEVVAVCDRKETVADLGSRNEIRDELLSRRIETQEKQILENCGARQLSIIGEPAIAMQPLALTLGEPAGIGPDLSLALWTQREALGVPPFLLLGDPAFLEARARSLGLAVEIAVSNAEQAVSTFATALPVMPLGVEVTALPGKPDATSAPPPGKRSNARWRWYRPVKLPRS
jgi:hypothetical protein